jgi:hypothetical protein
VDHFSGGTPPHALYAVVANQTKLLMRTNA